MTHSFVWKGMKKMENSSCTCSLLTAWAIADIRTGATSRNPSAKISSDSKNLALQTNSVSQAFRYPSGCSRARARAFSRRVHLRA